MLGSQQPPKRFIIREQELGHCKPGLVGTDSKKMRAGNTQHGICHSDLSPAQRGEVGTSCLLQIHPGTAV